jgi:hypothetical protein
VGKLIQFISSNKRPAKANVKERLDRALANTDWRVFFPNAKVKHFPIIKSDHAPILLLTQGDLNSYPKSFRFEVVWIRDTISNKVIFMAWNQPLLGSPAFKFSTKLKEVKKKLKEWNKETFGNIQHQLTQIKAELSALQNLEPTTSNLAAEENLKALHNELLAREEILWKQKSRTQWLTSSTLNTRFFHLATIIHRRKNAIDFLKDNNGN